MLNANHSPVGTFAKGNELHTKKVPATAKIFRDTCREIIIFDGGQMFTERADVLIDKWSQPEATMFQKMCLRAYLDSDSKLMWSIVEHIVGKAKSIETESGRQLKHYVITEIEQSAEEDPFRGEDV